MVYEKRKHEASNSGGKGATTVPAGAIESPNKGPSSVAVANALKIQSNSVIANAPMAGSPQGRFSLNLQ